MNNEKNLSAHCKIDVSGIHCYTKLPLLSTELIVLAGKIAMYRKQHIRGRAVKTGVTSRKRSIGQRVKANLLDKRTLFGDLRDGKNCWMDMKF